MLVRIVISLILGLLVGSILEFGYKSLEQKRWVRPRVINLQMYGLTAVFLYLLSFLHWPCPVEVGVIFGITTGLEFVTGGLYWRLKHRRAWDYSGERWNYRGLVCLKFSIYWLVLAASYYYLILPRLFST